MAIALRRRAVKGSAGSPPTASLATDTKLPRTRVLFIERGEQRFDEPPRNASGAAAKRAEAEASEPRRRSDGSVERSNPRLSAPALADDEQQALCLSVRLIAQTRHDPGETSGATLLDHRDEKVDEFSLLHDRRADFKRLGRETTARRVEYEHAGPPEVRILDRAREAPHAPLDVFGEIAE